MITYTDEEIETERKEAVERLPDQIGEPLSSIEERYQSECGFHEVLHTSHIFMENVEQYLLEHPAVALNKTAYRLAHQAHTALFNLYQHLGQLRFIEKDDEDDNAVDDFDFDLGVEEEYCPPGWLNFTKAHLLDSTITPQIKDQITSTLGFFAGIEDDEDCEQPNIGSFHVLVRLLELHPELPAPSLGVDREGLFNAVWQDQDHRWSLRLRPWAIDPSGVRNTECNILVTEVQKQEGRVTGMSSVEYAITDIKVPEWIKPND